jgi:ribonuclease P/MRP protein subunit POP5
MVRVKNRYLVANILYPATTSAVKDGKPAPSIMQFHAPTPDSLHTGQLIRLIRDGIENLFGDYGMGMVNRTLKGGVILPSRQFATILANAVSIVIYWSPPTSTAIIRCPREHYQMVWAALTFVTKLPHPNHTPVVIKVVRVSGTIRKAEEEVIRRAKGLIRRA